MSDQKNDKILEVKNLKVSYHTYAGEVNPCVVFPLI